MSRISKLLFPVILIANIVYAEIIDVGSFDTDGTAYDVWVEGNLAYIADGRNGLLIIDISNPEELEEVGSLDTDGSAFTIVLQGDPPEAMVWINNQQKELTPFLRCRDSMPLHISGNTRTLQKCFTCTKEIYNAWTARKRRCFEAKEI